MTRRPQTIIPVTLADGTRYEIHPQAAGPGKPGHRIYRVITRSKNVAGMEMGGSTLRRIHHDNPEAAKVAARLLELRKLREEAARDAKERASKWYRKIPYQISVFVGRIWRGLQFWKRR